MKYTLLGKAFAAALLIVGSLIIATPFVSHAQADPAPLQQVEDACPSGEVHPAGDTKTCAPLKRAIDCPSGKVSPSDSTKCAPLGNDCNGNTDTTCLKNSAFIKDLNDIVNIMSGAVGVVVIAMIILGGIQYSLAGDNANAQGEARKRITNSLIALVAFIFAYAFLQWLIPGGI